MLFSDTSPDLCDRITTEERNEAPATEKPKADRKDLLPPRLESIPSTESEYASLGNYNTDTELLVQENNSMEEEESASITMQPVIAFSNSPQHPNDVHDENHTHYSRSLYFEDGERVIDFVLVYIKGREEKERDGTKKQIRKQFASSLMEEGLQMERVKSSESGLKFVKLHAPWDVLIRYAEVMKLKMPMKQIETSWRLVFDDEDPYSKGMFTATFSRDKMYLFHIPAKKELFFSSSIRSQIVDFILKRKLFTANKSEAGNFGIDRLLQRMASS